MIRRTGSLIQTLFNFSAYRSLSKANFDESVYLFACIARSFAAAFLSFSFLPLFLDRLTKVFWQTFPDSSPRKSVTKIELISLDTLKMFLLLKLLFLTLVVHDIRLFTVNSIHGIRKKHKKQPETQKQVS